MALTWNDVTSKTNKFIIPALADNIYKASPVLTRLRTRNAERFEGGTTIKHPIMYAKLRGGSFARGGSFDITYVNTDTALEVDIKFYYVNATVYGTDNVLNRGPEAAMSYVESKLVNASARMADLMATDMYLDGTGTQNLDGFDEIIDNGNNITAYGGITRSDLVAAGTANQGINGYYASVATLSLAALQTAYGAAWFGSEHPDLIATTQAVWDILWNKMQPQQRFMEESSDIAKIGFMSLRWNGAQITVDQYAPSGKIYLLNTKHIQFWMSTLPKYQFGFTGWKEAQNTDDVAGQYLWAGNLLVPVPRLFSRIVGVTG